MNGRVCFIVRAVGCFKIYQSILSIIQPRFPRQIPGLVFIIVVKSFVQVKMFVVCSDILDFTGVSKVYQATYLENSDY
jgi:hypothetical protein